MQTFPPLCIYNFGLPRRTPSPVLPIPRDFSMPVRPPCRARTRPPYRERRRTRPRCENGGGPSLAGTFPRRRTEVDRAELTRTTTATNDERGLGWAAIGAKTWAGRQPGLGGDWHAARTTYVKMTRRKKTREIRGWSPHFGFAKSKCKVP